MRRKGEMSPSDLDRGWPYQVALPTEDERGEHLRFNKDAIQLFPRNHANAIGLDLMQPSRIVRGTGATVGRHGCFHGVVWERGARNAKKLRDARNRARGGRTSLKTENFYGLLAAPA